MAAAITLNGGGAGFDLTGQDLAAIQPGFAAVVVGSDLHAGPISVGQATASVNPLTLQNDAGVGGIAIGGNLSGPLLTLSSGGAINQSAPVVTNALLVRGGPASVVTLNNAANDVATLAVDPPASFNFVNRGPIVLGPLSGIGSLAGSGAAQVISASDSSASGNFQVQTLAGNLTLNQDITTLAPASNITLIAADLFDNVGANRLTPGDGGHWRVWSRTWNGEDRGGLLPTTPNPNFYGCSFGAASCASGVTLPAGGNRFIYAGRPSATAFADNQSRLYGGSNPPPTFANSAAGLINGDTASDATGGTLAHTALVTSSVGAYPIVATSLTSPTGYILQFVPGTLSVAPAPLTVAADNKLRLEGSPNPPATATVTGLVAGDTRSLADAAGLSLSTRAGVLSPAGLYSIDVAPFSLANYTVTALSGTLTVAANGAQSRQLREVIWQSTDLYGRNQGLPAMCMALDASIFDEADPGSDVLSIEWSRLRQKPNLSNCVDLAQRNDCSDF